MIPFLRCWTEFTNTFCTMVASPDMDSTKKTRSLLLDSPNTPGLTLDTSSRLSTLTRYSSLFWTAHGEMKMESAAITATSGPANIMTGFTHAAKDRPELNQMTISESR